MDNAPDLFAYNDFRRFLSDWLEWKAASEPGWSKAECSRRLGLPRSRSFLPDVLRGKHISEAFVERFVRVLECNGEQARFFRVLVRFNQAASGKERALAFEQLVGLQCAPRRVVGQESLEYYRSWRNAVVRALTGIGGLRSPEALAQGALVPLTLPQVRQALKLLERLGLVAPDSEGVLRPSGKALVADPRLGKELLRHLQLQVLDLARAALLRDGPDNRVFASNTLGISSSSLAAILRHLEKFQAEVRSIVHKDEEPVDRVWQLCLQFFPLAQPKDSP